VANVRLTLNGNEQVLTADVRTSLLQALRDAGFTGTKGACEEGECGSCSALVDGELVCACLVPAALCEGSEVVTVEGIVAPDLVDALARHGAVQCGFCTPGIVVAATVALERSGPLDDYLAREALAGNLCRCTGYQAIIAAVLEVHAGRRS
jgi:aerobic-type carbon monoxide dehydrogenase small subunit (CoxS/CutS family)